MRISILTTDPKHPVVPGLREWSTLRAEAGHHVSIVHSPEELAGGDVLFLVSCTAIVSAEHRENYRASLVLHASALPSDPGWSPHIWNILEGADAFTVTLLEAAEPVDSGAIWLQEVVNLEGHELASDINERLFAAEFRLMERAVSEFDQIVPQPQQGVRGPYRRKRTPADSELYLDDTIRNQFNLLRVVDNERFPAFFRHQGNKYILTIRREKE